MPRTSTSIQTPTSPPHPQPKMASSHTGSLLQRTLSTHRAAIVCKQKGVRFKHHLVESASVNETQRKDLYFVFENLCGKPALHTAQLPLPDKMARNWRSLDLRRFSRFFVKFFEYHSTSSIYLDSPPYLELTFEWRLFWLLWNCVLLVLYLNRTQWFDSISSWLPNKLIYNCQLQDFAVFYIFKLEYQHQQSIFMTDEVFTTHSSLLFFHPIFQVKDKSQNHR